MDQRLLFYIKVYFLLYLGYYIGFFFFFRLSRVKLAKNRLILDQIYSTLLYSHSFSLNPKIPNEPLMLVWFEGRKESKGK